jgi:hypothetical protein
MSYSAVLSDHLISGAKAFQQARARAGREKLWSWLSGRSANAPCFKDRGRQCQDEVAYRVDQEEVALEAVVGSVGRCADYTRGFLPLKDSDQARWTRVEQAFAESKPLPPIQVRQVGQDYYVIDGHHRVSVARQLGLSHLEARVLRPVGQEQIEC